VRSAEPSKLRSTDRGRPRAAHGARLRAPGSAPSLYPSPSTRPHSGGCGRAATCNGAATRHCGEPRCNAVAARRGSTPRAPEQPGSASRRTS